MIAVTKHLLGQHGAVKMLHGRLRLILDYVRAVEQGSLQRNEEVLREIASLCHRLPVMDSDSFTHEFHNQCNDITLMAYLGVLTKACGSLNQVRSHFIHSFVDAVFILNSLHELNESNELQLVNKLNVINDRHGPGSMRRGRGLLM